MPGRSRAREIVLQVLYRDDLNPDDDMKATELFLAERLRQSEDLIHFARNLILGVRRNQSELDQMLELRADNWSLDRMAATDRNILRMGAFEIVYSDTPGRVAINEAVELAKRYGGKQSPHFVNGILDRFLKESDAVDS